MQSNDLSATRIVLSHSADLSDQERAALRTDHYRRYLQRTLGDVSVGDETEEIVNCGCGTTRDVVLRVERIEAGEVGVDCGTVDDETAIDFDARSADTSPPA